MNNLLRSFKINSRLPSYIAEISPRVILNIGQFGGYLMFLVDIRHRRIVRRNLQLIYPTWSMQRIRSFSKAFFRQFGTMITEFLQMTCFSKEQLIQHVRLVGKENIDKGLSHPNGCIMVSAHIGNWEMMCLYLSCIVDGPFMVVSRKIKSKFLNRIIHLVRERFGTEMVDRKGAFSKMARALQKGATVGLLIDQSAKRSEAVEVQFLGKRATATPAAALLALRCKSPLLPMFCIRDTKGRMSLIVKPPIFLKRTNNLKNDIAAGTRLLTQAIEDAIHQYPEQWFWAHKKWKHYHPEYYHEDITKRQKRRTKRRNALQNEQ